MAGPHSILDVPYEAEEDLSSSQWCGVVAGTNDDQIALPAAPNAAKFQGILQDKPPLGENGNVRKLGISWAIAEGPINRGEALEIGNSSGHIKSLTAGVGSYCGTAEESAVDGDRFRMFVLPIELAGTGITFSSSSSSSSSST